MVRNNKAAGCGDTQAAQQNICSTNSNKYSQRIESGNFPSGERVKCNGLRPMPNSIASKTHRLLERLQHVKPAGQGKWLARCPAHDDRSPSLAIREVDDRILIHCFAGCELVEVLGAVGVEIVDLFPDRSINPDAPKAKPPRFSAYELFPLLVQEAVILALAWNEILAKGALSDMDLIRANQAYECVLRLHAEVSG